MARETELFLAALIDENRGVGHLIDADFTFANRRLAEHYGLPGVAGQRMRRVALPADSPRGGLLTHASVLKVTANGTTTSPVPRGNFVLANLLGQPPAPPPPGIEGLEPDTRGTTTIREQLTAHRANPVCASCHRVIDPPGFALESFDPIGGFRTSYRASGGESDVRRLHGARCRSSRACPSIRAASRRRARRSRGSRTTSASCSATTSSRWPATWPRSFSSSPPEPRSSSPTGMRWRDRGAPRRRRVSCADDDPRGRPERPLPATVTGRRAPETFGRTQERMTRGGSRMSRSCTPALFVIAILLLAPAGAGAQAAAAEQPATTEQAAEATPRTAVGRPRPGRHLGLPDHHAAGAPRGVRRPRLPDRGRGGQPRAGRGADGPRRQRSPGRADGGRRRRRCLQPLLVRLRDVGRRRPAHVAHRRSAERAPSAAHARGRAAPGLRRLVRGAARSRTSRTSTTSIAASAPPRSRSTRPPTTTTSRCSRPPTTWRCWWR